MIWIGVRPEHGAPLQPLTEARVIAGLGLEGDVGANGRSGGKRQVTLIQAEHLPVIAAFTRQNPVTPEQVRRNLVISGVNLLSLVKLRFRIGHDVVLVGTGPCAPCSSVGGCPSCRSGFQAMRGHGGITASVERGGILRVGDELHALADTVMP